MRARRLFAAASFALVAVLLGCVSHEEALESAATSLQSQIVDRERIPRDLAELTDYEQRLHRWDWKPIDDDGTFQAMPLPPISLEPLRLAPAILPELPPASRFASADEERARRRISELVAMIRARDRQWTELERRKEALKQRVADAEGHERAIIRSLAPTKMSEAMKALDAGPLTPMQADAGRMRRLSP